MKPIRVLITDDSVVYRSQIRAALSTLSNIEIVGAAANGKIALERLIQAPVDLLILDLEMPEMDGIETLRQMLEKNLKPKILVFSSVSKRGSEITLEALRLGASDFVTKPGQEDDDSKPGAFIEPSQKIKLLLEPKIQALFPEMNDNPLVQKQAKTLSSPYQSTTWELLRPGVIVIGSSTGGPTVLEKIFSELKGPLSCPIFITQHMPPIFTATLAERIQKLSGIPTYEAKHMQMVENAIYIAPGNYHMTLKREKLGLVTHLDQNPLINSVRPAVDPLFESAAHLFKEKCLGYVLTGMGADGKVGAEHIKRLGGTIVIQSEKSCVVFGMPGAVYTAGAYDKIMSPEEIITSLKHFTSKGTTQYAS